MSPTPIHLAWSDAVRAIRAEAHARSAPVVIGVTGAVASGKSTLARALTPCVLSSDHYLPDYDQTPEHLRDLPESSDLARLRQNLEDLRARRATVMPNWSFESHSRVAEVSVKPAELIVSEGLHALHESVRDQVDIAVYIEATREARWNRAMKRELAGDRPWSMEYLEHFFLTVAEPTFALHAERYRAAAHFIVINNEDARGDLA
jgi:uridine kinase